MIIPTLSTYHHVIYDDTFFYTNLFRATNTAIREPHDTRTAINQMNFIFMFLAHSSLLITKNITDIAAVDFFLSKQSAIYNFIFFSARTSTKHAPMSKPLCNTIKQHFIPRFLLRLLHQFLHHYILSQHNHR